MKQHHGSTICEFIAVVLLGIQMAENFFTLMDDLSAWNFFHKSFITIVAMHCAHAIFYQMAIWSNCSKDIASTLNSSPNPFTSAVKQHKNKHQDHFALTVLKITFKQLPLPLLTLAAVFHSITGVYFFYCLTGFVRQNFLKGGWCAYVIGSVDFMSVFVVFLWLRWALVFYTHEANKLQSNERTWRKILSIRWKYAAQCTCVLSLLLMSVAFLKLIHGVPYLRPEPISTTVTPGTWLLQITAVTLITLLSCFPHALCQVLACIFSIFGFVYISASEAEKHGDVYGVLYLLVPGAMAIGALVYHVLFSPGTTERALWTKIFCEVISLLLLFLMLAVVHYERKTLVLYTSYTSY